MAGKGVYLGVAGIGAIFIWSGLKGKSWSSVLRNVISGQNPAQALNSSQINPLNVTDIGSSGGSSSTGTVNAQGLTNPIGAGLTRGRIDEGVDFSGSGPLYAITSGTIRTVRGPWPGGVYIDLHGDDGQYYYYAENIVPAVTIGQHVSAGTLIGRAVNAYPYIEIGFGSVIPFTPAAHSHYIEGIATPEGQQFANLLSQLGAP